MSFIVKFDGRNFFTSLHKRPEYRLIWTAKIHTKILYLDNWHEKLSKKEKISVVTGSLDSKSHFKATGKWSSICGLDYYWTRSHKIWLWISLNSSKTMKISHNIVPFSFQSNKWFKAKNVLRIKNCLCLVISLICISANLLKQKEKLLTNKIKLIAIFAGAHFQRKFMMIIHHSETETVAFSLSFILFFFFFILYALCVCRWKSDYVSVFVSRKLFFAVDSLAFDKAKIKKASREMRSISKYWWLYSLHQM